MKILSTLMVICSLVFSNTIMAADATPMRIAYPHFTNGSQPPQAYKSELIKLILEQTLTEYGAYTLEFPSMADPTNARQALIMEEGAVLNVTWAAPGSIISKSKVIPVQFDILRGLLGYRMCLINKTGTADFSKVVDINSLTTISLGQGLGWSDVDIYKFNNIQPVIAPTFDGLMNMLNANRFACFPLGADEINGILSDFTKQMPNLAIEPKLLMYYDFPAYFYVSAKFPLIAERLKLGLKKIQDNGEFDKLFMRYYKGKMGSLNISSRKLICLKSPHLPAEKQCQASGPANMNIINAL